MTIAIREENGEISYFDNAALFEVEQGGFAHSFIFHSKSHNLLACSIEKALVEKCFSTGSFDADTFALFQNVAVELDVKNGGFTRLNAKWQLCPAVKGNKYITPALVAITTDGGNLRNGNLEIAQIRYIYSKAIRICGDKIATQYSSRENIGESSAHTQMNTMVLKENHSVINSQYSPDDCAYCNYCFHSKIKAFFRRLFNFKRQGVHK